MKNVHLPLLLLFLLCLEPLQGAVVLPDVDRYIWNFNMGTGTPSIVSPSSYMDILSVQFYADDRLAAPDLLKIRMYDRDSTAPMYSIDWGGSPNGSGALFVIADGWDELLASRWGRLELEMETGTVELRLLTLSFETGTTRYSTTFSPDVRLVPEPGVCMLVCFSGMLGLKRKR